MLYCREWGKKRREKITEAFYRQEKVVKPLGKLIAITSVSLRRRLFYEGICVFLGYK